MKKEETLEEAANKFSTQFLDKEDENSPYESQASLLGFKAGAKWQAERMFSRDLMIIFAGYVQGKKYSNPEMDLSEIMEEFEKRFKDK